MDTKTKEKPQKKDFNDLYQAAQAADCLEDWGDLINTLTQTMLQIFGMGDSPQPDMKDALDQFAAAVMAWQEKAVESDLSALISDRGYAGDSSPYVPYSLQVGSDSWGYMSRGRNPNAAQKAGAAFSQANSDAIHGHVAALHGMADGLLDALQGLGAPSDPSYREQGTTDDDEKSRRPHTPLARKASVSDKMVIGQHATDLHAIGDTIHQMAEDLAENTGASTYVDASGDADDAKETDKADSRTRGALRKHSPQSGTADSQEDLGDLISSLRKLGGTL